MNIMDNVIFVDFKTKGRQATSSLTELAATGGYGARVLTDLGTGTVVSGINLEKWVELDSGHSIPFTPDMKVI